MKIMKSDVKEGGMLQYWMEQADGSEMYGQVRHKTIRPHDLLIYSQNFCDKDGGLCKPPFAPHWPNSMLSTVTFAKIDETYTCVTVKWVVDDEATAIERETFHSAKLGMTSGWTGTFDKLDEFLASLV